ncbi:ABC transporter permease [Aestuariivirga sp.]|uniref:ABC transporter permease n=1 Tax=Aestuariivirga sp. TaxID=2650926 RepID=UPI0039E51003
MTGRKGQTIPVLVVCLVLVVVWYLACIPMNAVVAQAKIDAAGGGLAATLMESWNHPRPVIPAPHQIIVELWNTVFMIAPWKVKSLLYHCWVTLSSTLVGFFFGTVLGIGLAILIVHSKLLSKALMPWIIASQTIPILAIAPMIIVVLGAMGFTGLLPKALISTYLCFFPVTIGMVKGLMSPDIIHRDLMRTYNASAAETLWKLRLPASVPYLFTSLKIAIAIALTGAIVGELPTGAIAGIGARLLVGSYNGLTMMIWSALVAGSAMAAILVWLVGYIERKTLARMGVRA